MSIDPTEEDDDDDDIKAKAKSVSSGGAGDASTSGAAAATTSGATDSAGKSVDVIDLDDSGDKEELQVSSCQLYSLTSVAHKLSLLLDYCFTRTGRTMVVFTGNLVSSK